jgi:hypothetical protein
MPLVYVPAATWTMSPAFALSAAFWSVFQGADEPPAAESLPDGETY